MTHKKFYFLAGLPRSGNTLLASLLNQNPLINVSANSLLSTILYNIVENNVLNKEQNLILNNFPDHESVKNCVTSCFEGYYKNWKGEIIIDRSNWGTPYNLKVLEDFCPNTPKFICLVRPLNDILSSFIRLYVKNKVINPKNTREIERQCELIMSPDGVLQRGIVSTVNLFKGKHKDQTLFLSYEDLCGRPQWVLNKLYEFLDLSPYQHNLEKIEQYEVNGVIYNDNINKYYKNLHALRSTIHKITYNSEDILPNSVHSKYKKYDFRELIQ